MRSTVLTTEKIAEFAPMANARVRIAAAVKVGALAKVRTVYRAS